ncbi:hypothetical protein ABZX95_14740 [Streptomyces sp. NPDC004232]|uniref:hypothetical protein n=1 Tax=Streptomyces sp. NPDC004232 TaxID=3154454 RepID=UPI00339E95C3
MPSHASRRVPGLRREQVALLDGVSTDYYTRMEQGRERHPRSTSWKQSPVPCAWTVTPPAACSDSPSRPRVPRSPARRGRSARN